MATVTLAGSDGAGDLDLFVLTDNGGGCDPEQCVDFSGSGGANEEVTFDITAGVTCYLVVDGFGGATGDYNISLTRDVDPGTILLTFWEKLGYETNPYGQHELLIGPAVDDTPDPTSPFYTLMADGAAMDNPGWSPLTTDWFLRVVTDVTAFSGLSVQVAFHYCGDDNDDKWYIDDVCVGIDDGGEHHAVGSG